MAVAGCINAYDCAGCYLTTLQQLQSDNIGVAINYTAPSEYWRRQLDYIKYTDKCGCTCCLTGENELRIVATQWVIKNFTLTNDDTNEVVNVKWNDLFGSNRAYTMVRYKTGSYPTSITDGTLAVKETTQNQYATNGYNVSWLTDWTTYYFTAFAVSQDGTIIVVQNKTVTADFNWKPDSNTVLYIPFETDIAEKSWWCTITNSWVSLQTAWWVLAWYFNWSAYINTSLNCVQSINKVMSVRYYTTSSWNTWIINSNPCGVYAWDWIAFSWLTAILYYSYANSREYSVKKEWLPSLSGAWHNLCFTNWKLFLDWVLQATNTSISFNGNNRPYTVWWHAVNSSCSPQRITWYMRYALVRNAWWTDDEYYAYYNKVKRKFWIT